MPCRCSFSASRSDLEARMFLAAESCRAASAYLLQRGRMSPGQAGPKAAPSIHGPKRCDDHDGRAFGGALGADDRPGQAALTPAATASETPFHPDFTTLPPPPGLGRA